MLYSEKVMDHFMNPRNVGKIDDADGVGEVGNAKCGDIMKIYIKVDNNIITDVKFKNLFLNISNHFSPFNLAYAFIISGDSSL